MDIIWSWKNVFPVCCGGSNTCWDVEYGPVEINELHLNLRADCCSICPGLSVHTRMQICTCICTRFYNRVICPCSCFPLDNLIPSLNLKKKKKLKRRAGAIKSRALVWKQTFRIRAQRKLTHNHDVLNPFWSVKGEYSYHLLGERTSPLGLDGLCVFLGHSGCTQFYLHVDDELLAGWPFPAKPKIWYDNWKNSHLVAIFVSFWTS